MKRPPKDLTRWVLPAAAMLFGIVLTVVGLTGFGTDDAYERGQYDGAHDLCQEVGGSWFTSEGGWCDMPDAR